VTDERATPVLDHMRIGDRKDKGRWALNRGLADSERKLTSTGATVRRRASARLYRRTTTTTEKRTAVQYR
jgi:hypothetical protein